MVYKDDTYGVIEGRDIKSEERKRTEGDREQGV